MKFLLIEKKAFINFGFFPFSRDEISLVVNQKRIIPEYCCITTLRGLELKRNDPDLWNRLQLLMDHDEDRRLDSEYTEKYSVS